ncbi:MAG: MAE_28990/MAE_18760 family HEPN-like nuclease [Xenococcus sp. MO_188.B8]|nr:MAE_28990/MAE_18760 family HEPN-like nuclease [Xenococcus sp. MO_188.B8]
MFQKLLQQAKDNISTVRSVIKTNENLRVILLNERKTELQESEDYIELLDLLQKDIPNTKEWRIYDHCAAVTKVYAIYENFVEDLIRDWLRLLPELGTSYDNLEDRIRNTHQLGVGRMLLDLNKNRYKHLSVKDVINGLHLGVNNIHRYELLPDAFLFHEQNLRREILDKLLADAGISNSWTWITRHKSMKNFIEEIRGSILLKVSLMN